MINNIEKSVQIIFPEGESNDVKLVGMSTRTVKMVVFPRNEMNTAIKRKEAEKFGIYFLIGKNESGDKPTVYMGTSLKLSRGIKKHDTKKENWETGLYVFANKKFLTKSHLKCLEWFCYTECKKVDRYILDQNVPKKLPITEEVEAELVDVFGTIKILLRAIKCPIFEKSSKMNANVEASNSGFIAGTETSIFHHPV